MRAVVQRVSRARVVVEDRVTGEIGAGLMILLGVGKEDTAAVAGALAAKVANLRIFEDEQGKMNVSLLETRGSALVVSQFTLYGDARGQRRPSFIAAAPFNRGRENNCHNVVNGELRRTPLKGPALRITNRKYKAIACRAPWSPSCSH